MAEKLKMKVRCITWQWQVVFNQFFPSLIHFLFVLFNLNECHALFYWTLFDFQFFINFCSFILHLHYGTIHCKNVYLSRRKKMFFFSSIQSILLNLTEIASEYHCFYWLMSVIYVGIFFYALTFISINWMMSTGQFLCSFFFHLFLGSYLITLQNGKWT